MNKSVDLLVHAFLLRLVFVPTPCRVGRLTGHRGIACIRFYQPKLSVPAWQRCRPTEHVAAGASKRLARRGMPVGVFIDERKGGSGCWFRCWWTEDMANASHATTAGCQCRKINEGRTEFCQAGMTTTMICCRLLQRPAQLLAIPLLCVRSSSR